MLGMSRKEIWTGQRSKDWLTIEDGEGVIDEEAVYNYVI